jgi:hypothetical protein
MSLMLRIQCVTMIHHSDTVAPHEISHVPILSYRIACYRVCPLQCPCKPLFDDDLPSTRGSFSITTSAICPDLSLNDVVSIKKREDRARKESTVPFPRKN